VLLFNILLGCKYLYVRPIRPRKRQ